MKILYAAFDPVPFPKGSAVRIEATIRALLKAGAQVRLVTPAPPRPVDGFNSQLNIPGLEHVPVPCQGEHFLDRAMAFREAVRTRVAENVDDVLFFRSIWEGLPMVESGRFCVYEAHGFPSMELPSHFPSVSQRPELLEKFVLQEQLCLHRARRVLTPSFTGKTYLMTRGVRSGSITVIPNSIISQDYPEPTDCPPGPPWRVAYMGTMAPWQGLTVLLESLARFKGRLDIKLVLAGPRKGRWMRQARHVARGVRVRSMIDFTGPLAKPELRELLSGCHLFLAPLPNDPRNSAQGCCPIKILEYMACGRPVVSTAIRPVQELIEHGKTGWLVAPNSPYSLAQGISHLLEDEVLRKTIATQARESVMERFPRARFDEQLRSLLHDLRQELKVPLTLH
jgi:glycosyltransferase involved in cell wall biosynthesis